MLMKKTSSSSLAKEFELDSFLLEPITCNKDTYLTDMQHLMFFKEKPFIFLRTFCAGITVV